MLDMIPHPRMARQEPGLAMRPTLLLASVLHAGPALVLRGPLCSVDPCAPRAPVLRRPCPPRALGTEHNDDAWVRLCPPASAPTPHESLQPDASFGVCEGHRSENWVSSGRRRT